MDPTLGSGDNRRFQQLSPKQENKGATTSGDRFNEQEQNKTESEEHEKELKNVTPQVIEDHENKLKDRIAQCRHIIESLKFELNEEKVKLEKDTNTKIEHPQKEDDELFNFDTELTAGSYDVATTSDILSDFPFKADMYCACVDSKLNCDENLIEYEKQLEKYQSTLNMAQLEKKNAIRKQMLAKAYKLKLLELENQCNIELLRVKQSLQCLEPLQMIASKWKTGSDEGLYNLDKFELMPCYPAINASSGVEFEDTKDEQVESRGVDINDISISE